MGHEGTNTLEVRLHWKERLIDVRHFAEGEPVTLGESARLSSLQAFAPELGVRHPLACLEGERVHVSLPLSTRLTLLGSQRAPAVLPSGDHTVWLGAEEAAQVQMGNLSVEMRRTPAPAPARRDWRDVDPAFAKTLCFCAMAFVTALLLSSAPGFVVDEDEPAPLSEVARHVAPRITLPTPKPAPAPKSAGKEGEAGELNKPRQKVAPPRGTDALAKRSRVLDTGALAALDAAGPGMNRLLENGGTSEGVNHALNRLRSDSQIGVSGGFQGLGARHTGPGGGDGVGFRLGSVGTREGRSGGPDGFGLRAGQKVVVTPAQSPTLLQGGLSRDVVAKVIQRHQREIKWCYEQELSRDPSLAGKVAVLFTIDGTGSVAEAAVAESSLGSDAAERCMVSRIQRWKFPEPSGGGVVSVNFPWVFNAAGGED